MRTGQITMENLLSLGVFLRTSGLRPQFLGRALAAPRLIGMTNQHVDGHSAYLW